LESTTVTISCATEGAAIQYKLGTGEWLDYSTPFPLAATTTVTAKATHATLTASDESAAVAFTKVTPMSVDDAIDYIDAGENLEGQFVTGIVSQVDGINSNAITYWISDDGTTTTQLEVYKGKGLNGADFSALTDIEVGDVVVVYGNLTLYNSCIYEFSAGSQIKSLVEILDNDLTETGSINLSMASPSVTADVNDYISGSSGGALTFASNNTGVATVDALGIVTPVAAGSTAITVTQAATATYKGGSTTVSVMVSAASKTDNAIVLSLSNKTTPYGTPFNLTYEVEDGYDGVLEYAVAPADIASVGVEGNTMTITPLAVGTATITFSADATATFNAADDEAFVLTVTAPSGGTTGSEAPETLFNETFDDCAGTGGHDDNWSGSIASSTVNYDNAGWTLSGGGGASKCVKLNKGANIQTPSISLSGETEISVSFKAAGWNGESGDIALSCNDAKATLSSTTAAFTEKEWNTRSFTISGIKESSIKLTFTAPSGKRFFLDDVVVKTLGVEISTTLNASGYATFCSQYPLDFSKANAEDKGFTAWQVTNVNSSTGVITFSQITGSVKGGTGILLMGEAGETVTLTSANSNNTLDDNKLVGTMAPTYVANDAYYGLSGNEFVKVNAGTVPAGKALLPVGALDVKALSLEFDNADGIVEMRNGENETMRSEVFDLSGRRVVKPTKGLYIVNGKKIMVK